MNKRQKWTNAEDKRLKELMKGKKVDDILWDDISSLMMENSF